MNDVLPLKSWQLVGALLVKCVVAMAAEEGLQFSVRPRDPATIIGTPVELLLQFDDKRPDGSVIDLGYGGLQNMSLQIVGNDGRNFDAKYIVHDGFADHSETKFTVQGSQEYGFLLDEFITLDKAGQYRIVVSIAGGKPLQAQCSVVLISDGRRELAALAALALDRQANPNERVEAGRLLAYNFRAEAVPFLIELSQQHSFHGTRVMTTAIESLMRSNDQAAIRWLWEQAAKGRVPALVQYKDAIASMVLKDAGEKPTTVKSEIVK